jgi:D-3-phosphoglycerate dehydrogenase
MATNKKKLLITQSMSKVGWDLFKERGDIEAVQFVNTIASADFRALLETHAPVNGVALGVTPFGEAEIAASREMLVVARIGVGYDAVDVPALTKKKIPLMVAGSANSPSVAEQAMFMMMTLAKRGAELNAMVQSNQWAKRMSAVPVDLFGKTVLIVGFGRIGTRSAKRCQAMEMKVLVFDPYKPAADIKAVGCEAVTDLDAGYHGPTRHHPLSEDARDGRHVQCRTARAHETYRLSRQHARAAASSTNRPARGSEHRQAAGAGLDVYEKEPVQPDNPPLKLANGSAPAHGGRDERVARSDGPADGQEHPERVGRQADPRERHQPGSAGLSCHTRGELRMKTKGGFDGTAYERTQCAGHRRQQGHRARHSPQLCRGGRQRGHRGSAAEEPGRGEVGNRCRGGQH